MIKHNIDINDRIISKPVFSQTYPDDISLDTKVLTYFDGNKWKVILHSLLLSNPVIYDKYIDTDESITDVSILYCPFSSTTGIFFGNHDISEFVNENVMMFKTNDGHIFSPIDGKNVENDKQIQIRRMECGIKTFRDALMQHQDFLMCISSKTKPNMVDVGYIVSEHIMFSMNQNDDMKKYHPKTLVYLLQYTSMNDKKKCSILINSNANKQTISGYNVTGNGITNYLANVETKIRSRFGIITPMYWFVAIKYCPNAKLVYINNIY